MTTLKVTFDSCLIRDITKYEDYPSLCSDMMECKHCPLFYYESCEETFNAIKEESKWKCLSLL